MFKDLYGFLSELYETFHDKRWNDWEFWSDVKREYSYIMHWRLSDVIKEDFNVW